jgi:FlaA1/EpsC-like NDP-sugar epimerase
MGEQLKIYDLAQKLVHLSGRSIAAELGGDGIAIIEVGLRPGEKMYEELLISGEQQATGNEKIYKSEESFPDKEIVSSVIEQIKDAVTNNQHQKIVSIFKQHVEGYTS